MAFARSSYCEVAVYVPRASRFLFLLKKWGAPKTTRFENVYQLGNLWLVEGTRRTDVLPFTLDVFSYQLDAHEFQDDLECSVVVGRMVRREHWFYSYYDNAVKVPASEIVDKYPDQARFVDRSDPDYDRSMELKDIEISIGLAPFAKFASERLFIRTSKHKVSGYLTDHQLLQAARFEGPPLVSFDLSPLQKRYLAMKRLADRKSVV